MNEEFKKEVLKQITRTTNELDKLLKIEGSVGDIQELPNEFVNTVQEALKFFESCKERIEQGARCPMTISSRSRYARSPALFRDE
jgi:hypothetical protein